jgi:predicted alpha/beta hydrolase
VNPDVVAASGLFILFGTVAVMLFGMIKRTESKVWLLTCLAVGLIGLGLLIYGGITSSTTGTREECGVVVIEGEVTYVCVEVRNLWISRTF